MVTNVANRMVLAVSAVAVALMLGMACSATALAEEVLESPFQVSDDVTRLQVSKLDKADHSYVEGATLQVAEKATGAVVDTWTTGKDMHEISKALDVEKEYVLTEVSAPKGYAIADPVTFKINPEEGGGIQVISGGDAQLAGDYGLNMYDSKLETEKVVHEKSERTVTTTSTTGKSGPKTGDATLFWPVVLIGIAALAVIVFSLFRIRNNRTPKHARR